MSTEQHYVVDPAQQLNVEGLLSHLEWSDWSHHHLGSCALVGRAPTAGAPWSL